VVLARNFVRLLRRIQLVFSKKLRRNLILAKHEFISAGNAQIAVEWAGAGQPIVFLHANVTDRRMWRHSFELLAKTNLVIAFDRRGFGETVYVDEDYSQTGDLFSVLDHIAGINSKAILVGCSRGGSISLDAALASPHRILGLVLIAPGVSGAPAVNPTDTVRMLLDDTDHALKTGDLKLVNELQAALWLDGPQSQAGRVSGEARELFMTMNEIVLAATPKGRAHDPAPAWNKLDQISIPVDVLCGTLDIPHIYTRSEKLASLLPHGRFTSLKEMAHLPNLERPQYLAELLETLIKEMKS